MIAENVPEKGDELLSPTYEKDEQKMDTHRQNAKKP